MIISRRKMMRILSTAATTTKNETHFWWKNIIEKVSNYTQSTYYHHRCCMLRACFSAKTRRVIGNNMEMHRSNEMRHISRKWDRIIMGHFVNQSQRLHARNTLKPVTYGKEMRFVNVLRKQIIWEEKFVALRLFIDWNFLVSYWLSTLFQWLIYWYCDELTYSRHNKRKR